MQTTPTPAQLPQQQEVPINVKFISIKVVNDHDPDGGIFSSGRDGGDWILDAFVNGQNVHLSANKLLDEVYTGSTYQFPPTAQATVNVPRNGYLTINTLGTDVDGCDVNPQLIPQQLPPAVQKLLSTGGLPGLSSATKYIDALGPALGLPIPAGVSSVLSSLGLRDPLKAASSLISSIKCKLNPNDSRDFRPASITEDRRI